jgi:hypothetical protein
MKLLVLLLILVGCSTESVVEGIVTGVHVRFDGLRCFKVSTGQFKEVSNQKICHMGEYNIDFGRRVRIYQEGGATVLSDSIIKVVYLDE